MNKMKSWDVVKNMIKNKEIDINNYVVLVPQELYEHLIAESEPKVEENIIPIGIKTGMNWNEVS